MRIALASALVVTIHKENRIRILDENNPRGRTTEKSAERSILVPSPCLFHFPITSMGTVIVLGGMQAFLSQA
jgi:hypothetical protein